jgi:2-keto-4-pentenoate hydratase
MDQREVAAAVDEFAAARARGEYFPLAWFDRLSLDDAYRLQLALIGRRGAQRVGWKVGLTSTRSSSNSRCTNRCSAACWPTVASTAATPSAPTS